MSDERSEFYQSHLDRVSRSFAFCIPRLREPHRERVGLSYLLCRLLDTIEDAPWSSFEEQEQSFLQFDALISGPPSRRAIDFWVQTLPQDLPAGERALLLDANRLIHDFHEWPASVHKPVSRLILSMSAGMRHYMQRKVTDGELRLRDLHEVNSYCLFVAGVVGEMLTEIIREGEPAESAQLLDSYRFGLFLQKVNLLKDQLGDEPQGRFLVPSRPLVLKSALSDASRAYAYLQSLAAEDPGFQLFCAWCLLLGLASIPYLQQSFNERTMIKIPRDETQMLLGLIESSLPDLEELYRGLYVAAQEALAVAPEFSDEAEVQDVPRESLYPLYNGKLREAEFLSVT